MDNTDIRTCPDCGIKQRMYRFSCERPGCPLAGGASAPTPEPDPETEESVLDGPTEPLTGEV